MKFISLAVLVFYVVINIQHINAAISEPAEQIRTEFIKKFNHLLNEWQSNIGVQEAIKIEDVNTVKDLEIGLFSLDILMKIYLNVISIPLEQLETASKENIEQYTKQFKGSGLLSRQVMCRYILSNASQKNKSVALPYTLFPVPLKKWLSMPKNRFYLNVLKQKDICEPLFIHKYLQLRSGLFGSSKNDTVIEVQKFLRTNLNRAIQISNKIHKQHIIEILKSNIENWDELLTIEKVSTDLQSAKGNIIAESVGKTHSGELIAKLSKSGRSADYITMFGSGKLIEVLLKQQSGHFPIAKILENFLAAQSNETAAKLFFTDPLNRQKIEDEKNEIRTIFSRRLIRNAAACVFNNIWRSFTELQVNACDATLKARMTKTQLTKQTGKFGIGFLSILQLMTLAETGGVVIKIQTRFESSMDRHPLYELLYKENPQTENADKLISYEITISLAKKFEEIDFKKDFDLNIDFKMLDESSKLHKELQSKYPQSPIKTGTLISIYPAREGASFDKYLDEIKKYTHYLDFYGQVSSVLEFRDSPNECIGTNLNAPQIFIRLNPDELNILDNGTGIPLITVLFTLFIPSLSTKRTADLFTTRKKMRSKIIQELENATKKLNQYNIGSAEIKYEMFKGKEINDHNSHFLITVGDVLVVNVALNRVIKSEDGKVGDILIHMPVETQIPVARDEILVSHDSTFNSEAITNWNNIGFEEVVLNRIINETIDRCIESKNTQIISELFEGLKTWENASANTYIKGKFSGYLNSLLQTRMDEMDLIPVPEGFTSQIGKNIPKAFKLIELSPELANFTYSKLENMLPTMLGTNNEGEFIAGAANQKFIYGKQVFFVDGMAEISTLGLRNSIFVPTTYIGSGIRPEDIIEQIKQALKDPFIKNFEDKSDFIVYTNATDNFISMLQAARKKLKDGILPYQKNGIIKPYQRHAKGGFWMFGPDDFFCLFFDESNCPKIYDDFLNKIVVSVCLYYKNRKQYYEKTGEEQSEIDKLNIGIFDNFLEKYDLYIDENWHVLDKKTNKQVNFSESFKKYIRRGFRYIERGGFIQNPSRFLELDLQHILSDHGLSVSGKQMSSEEVKDLLLAPTYINLINFYGLFGCDKYFTKKDFEYFIMRLFEFEGISRDEFGMYPRVDTYDFKWVFVDNEWKHILIDMAGIEDCYFYLELFFKSFGFEKADIKNPEKVIYIGKQKIWPITGTGIKGEIELCDWIRLFYCLYAIVTAFEDYTGISTTSYDKWTGRKLGMEPLMDFIKSKLTETATQDNNIPLSAFEHWIDNEHGVFRPRSEFFIGSKSGILSPENREIIEKNIARFSSLNSSLRSHYDLGNCDVAENLLSILNFSLACPRLASDIDTFKERIIGILTTYMDSSKKPEIPDIKLQFPKPDNKKIDNCKALVNELSDKESIKQLFYMTIEDCVDKCNPQRRDHDISRGYLSVPFIFVNSPLSVLADLYTNLNKSELANDIIKIIVKNSKTHRELFLVANILLTPKIVTLLANKELTDMPAIICSICKKFIGERIDKEFIANIYEECRTSQNQDQVVTKFASLPICDSIYEYILESKNAPDTTDLKINNEFFKENIDPTQRPGLESLQTKNKLTIEGQSFLLSRLINAHMSGAGLAKDLNVADPDMNAIIEKIRKADSEFKLDKITQNIEFGSERDPIHAALIECLQNSFDAINDFIKKEKLDPNNPSSVARKLAGSKAPNITDIFCQVECLKGSSGFHLCLSWCDCIGFPSLKQLLTDFVLPDYSAKGSELGNVGDMGNGTFKIYQHAKIVFLLTRLQNNPDKFYLLIIEPVRSEKSGNINNLRLDCQDVSDWMKTHNKNFFGTSFKIIFEEKNKDDVAAEILETKYFFKECLGTAQPKCVNDEIVKIILKFLDPDTGKIVRKPINFTEEAKTELETIYQHTFSNLSKNSQDVMNKKVGPENRYSPSAPIFRFAQRKSRLLQSYLTTNGIPFKSLSSVLNEENLFPPNFVENLSYGYVLDIGLNTYAPVQSRTKLQMNFQFKNELRKALLEAFFILGLKTSLLGFNNIFSIFPLLTQNIEGQVQSIVQKQIKFGEFYKQYTTQETVTPFLPNWPIVKDFYNFYSHKFIGKTQRPSFYEFVNKLVVPCIVLINEDKNKITSSSEQMFEKLIDDCEKEIKSTHTGSEWKEVVELVKNFYVNSDYKKHVQEQTDVFAKTKQAKIDEIKSKYEFTGDDFDNVLYKFAVEPLNDISVTLHNEQDFIEHMFQVFQRWLRK